MAVARAGLDDRHLGVVHHIADKPLAAARDQHIHIAADGHQRLGARALGALHKADAVARQVVRLQRVADNAADGTARFDGFLAAAQYRRIAAADAERRRVERDIRARLKNHGDHAERHAALGDMDARRGRPGLPAAHRVVEACQSPHRLCHAGEAGVGQTQTVKHRRGHAVFRRRGEVERICGEDVAACRLHTVGEIEEHRTARLVRRGIQRGGRRLRAFFKFENVVVDFHGVCPLVGLIGRPY